MEAFFECQRCGQLVIVEQDSHIFKKPTVCSNPACGGKGPFQLLEDQSRFMDWQQMTIEENGFSKECFLWDDIVNSANAGDRIIITGIPKTRQEGKKRHHSQYISKLTI